MQRALFHRAAQLCVLPRSLGMQDPCPGISCCASVQRGPRPYTQTDLSVQAHIGRNASPRRQHWFTSAFIRLIGPGYNAGVTLNEDLRVRALLGFSSCLYLHIYTRLRHSGILTLFQPTSRQPRNSLKKSRVWSHAKICHAGLGNQRHGHLTLHQSI